MNRVPPALESLALSWKGLYFLPASVLTRQSSFISCFRVATKPLEEKRGPEWGEQSGPGGCELASMAFSYRSVQHAS